jgi:hypothetical protein
MKNNLILSFSIIAIAVASVFSCKKKDNTNNTTTTTGGTTSSSTTGGSTSGTTTSGTTTSSTTGGTTGGGTNNLQNNQWSVNGKVYTATNNPVWSKNTNGINTLTANATSGDTTILIYFTMPDYLMASSNYTLVWATIPLTPTTMSVGIAKSTSAGYFSYNYITDGGLSTITNQGGVFSIECTNAKLNNVSLTAKLSSPIPVIPAANANFTAPSGFTANQISIGATNYTLNQLAIQIDNGLALVEGDVVTNNFVARGIKFWFTNSYPPSGTYDIVASKSAVTPGKVFIEYVNTSPLELYNSPSGGTITVITDANDVSVTAANITLNKVVGAGGATLTINGNIKH